MTCWNNFRNSVGFIYLLLDSRKVLTQAFLALSAPRARRTFTTVWKHTWILQVGGLMSMREDTGSSPSSPDFKSIFLSRLPASPVLGPSPSRSKSLRLQQAATLCQVKSLSQLLHSAWFLALCSLSKSWCWDNDGQGKALLFFLISHVELFGL